MPIRVTVWGENVHERESALVRSLYPEGMHTTIAAGPRRGRRDSDPHGHISRPRARAD
jgi:trehalose utilization protein